MEPTLLIADYPVGFASGFGETLFNLFDGFDSNLLWSAHPKKNLPVANKMRGVSVQLPAPERPKVIPSSLALGYYPFLKAQQFAARRSSVINLSNLVKSQSIKNLLVVPVSPWILSVALEVHRRHSGINLVLFVMDDWQGHHESYGLPFPRNRKRLLDEAIRKAGTRFAVSLEMASHYQETYGYQWRVAHNGVDLKSVSSENGYKGLGKEVLLAGDVNIFRFDAVLAFAEAIDRHNQRNGNKVQFTILGDVAGEYSHKLTSLSGVKLKRRQSHEFSLNAMKEADLLYLPLAFSEKTTRISLYSLPTKLPEYLASGRPVFFHAPSNSALYQVAERYDLNPRLATRDSETLDNFVESWTKNRDSDPSVYQRAKRALIEEFDRAKLASTFQSAFA